MALMNCPECNKEISDMAKSCPHCGYPFIESKDEKRFSSYEGNKYKRFGQYDSKKTQRPGTENHKKTGTNKHEYEKKKNPAVGCLSLVFLTIFMFFAFKSCPDSSTTQNPTTRDYGIEAWIMAQDFIDDQLKAPATAKYQSYTKNNIVKDVNDDYLVKIYVDSENSFGANIRTTFYVTLHSDGDNWTLIDIVFTE